MMKQCIQFKLKHTLIVCTVVGLLLLRLIFKYRKGEVHNDIICYEDFFTSNYGAVVCRPKCPRGFFSLPFMDECHKQLGCREIHSDKFKTQKHIGNGAVKSVHLAEWNGHKVALNSLINKQVGEDFRHGLAMLSRFNGSPYTTQLLGHCKQAYVTEYHPFGDASKFLTLLEDTSFLYLRKSVKARFGFCINYVQILNFLHTRPEGAYVMCDSNDLKKTLQQYLIRSDFQLLANDLDALPLANEATNKTVKCGHRVIQGEFPAPEQLWPYDTDFIDDLMPGYYQHIDIWKIPDVCNHFLGEDTNGYDTLQFHLFSIHNRCKDRNPKLRPTAGAVLKEYARIFDML